ncbi:hypothetical protein BG011_005018 [Mortierella polycephala]|uniref:AIG1-type G domain-containing protein n=1 Tax=Mortierella polycephala TaxID=41804 RepID=A0A9P6U9R7_9FUNG|nr:hypothetical protein BG011_005018 [Mortierella polycephala]
MLNQDQQQEQDQQQYMLLLQQQQHELQQQQQRRLSQQQAEANASTREFTVVALGKSGEGKSTLLNSILGREMFLAKASVTEVTRKVDQATNNFLNIPSNPIMHCIDTPSFNGQLHDPDRVKEIGALLTKVAAGVDAFLFVVKCTHYRLLTPAFWPKVIIVFSHYTPELLPVTQPRLQLMAWAREIQESFQLPAPPLTVFAMDPIRFPYPSGGAQEFWEALMTLDANTDPYCHKPFLESFGNGISIDGYVQRMKGYLAVFEPSFFEEQAEGQYRENEHKKKKESRFSLFRKGTNATAKSASASPSTPSTPLTASASLSTASKGRRTFLP